MNVAIPEQLYVRPFRLWLWIGLQLLRHRPGYFVILPFFLGAALALSGMGPGQAALTAAAAFVFSWAALTMHEFGHVAILLQESYGFSGVRLYFSPGGLKAVDEHVRWLWYRVTNTLMMKGLPVKAKREIQPPEAGYLKVVGDMLLSSHAKMRIALAGVVAPFLIWLPALAVWLGLFWSGQRSAMASGAAVLAAGFVYLVVHPFFAGVVYTGKAYSDLSYVGNYLMRDREVLKANPLLTIARLVRGMLRQAPGLAFDLASYLVRPRAAVAISRMEGMKPKRTCLSWVYKRDPEGNFTNCVIVLAPLGMALLKRLTASPRGAEKIATQRLLADPENLRRLVSYNRVYSMEFNPLASRAWELADGELDVRQIAHQISDETAKPIEVVLPALKTFFSDMHRKYMVNLNWPREPVREYPRLPDVVFDYGDVGAMVRSMLGKA